MVLTCLQRTASHLVPNNEVWGSVKLKELMRNEIQRIDFAIHRQFIDM